MTTFIVQLFEPNTGNTWWQKYDYPVTEKQIEQAGREIVDNWNNSLKEDEFPREFKQAIFITTQIFGHDTRRCLDRIAKIDMNPKTLECHRRSMCPCRCHDYSSMVIETIYRKKFIIGDPDHLSDIENLCRQYVELMINITFGRDTTHKTLARYTGVSWGFVHNIGSDGVKHLGISPDLYYNHMKHKFTEDEVQTVIWDKAGLLKNLLLKEAQRIDIDE